MLIKLFRAPRELLRFPERRLPSQGTNIRDLRDLVEQYGALPENSDRDVCKDSGSGVDWISGIRQGLCRALGNPQRALRFPERRFPSQGTNIRDVQGLVASMEIYSDAGTCSSDLWGFS